MQDALINTPPRKTGPAELAARRRAAERGCDDLETEMMAACAASVDIARDRGDVQALTVALREFRAWRQMIMPGGESGGAESGESGGKVDQLLKAIREPTDD